MKKFLLILCALTVIISGMSSCRHEVVYYHNRNGKIKHRKAHNMPAWFNVKEKGYSKRTRRIMKEWDRQWR